MIDLTAFIDWFGTAAGLLGVTIAVYLQFVNPRRCDHIHVAAIFVAGASLIMIFSSAWQPNPALAAVLKVFAIALFVGLELAAGYYVWASGEVVQPREAIASFFESNGAP